MRVNENDAIIVTLGSMTEASSTGDMDRAPVRNGKTNGGAWTLWERIASSRPEFGRPSTFADHIADSKWASFTNTLSDTAFFRLVRDFTGNVPREGSLVTFAESGWLASIVLPHQPQSIDQPDDVASLLGLRPVRRAAWGLCEKADGRFNGSLQHLPINIE